MNLELLTDDSLLALLEDAAATPNMLATRNLIRELCRRYRLALDAAREREVIQDGNADATGQTPVLLERAP